MRTEPRPDTLRQLKEDLADLLADESALTTMEYALLLALLAVGAIAAYRVFGQATSDLATDSTQSLPGNDGTPPPASP